MSVSEATECICPVNEAGDIRCHVCREYVNKKCWKCHTPRGEGGPCPKPNTQLLDFFKNMVSENPLTNKGESVYPKYSGLMTPQEASRAQRRREEDQERQIVEHIDKVMRARWTAGLPLDVHVRDHGNDIPQVVVDNIKAAFDHFGWTVEYKSGGTGYFPKFTLTEK